MKRAVSLRTSRAWRQKFGGHGSIFYRVDWQLSNSITGQPIELSPWVLQSALPEPEPGEHYFWSDSRQFVNRVCGWIKRMGGRFSILEVNYYRCPLCRRILLGVDADTQRDMNEKAGAPMMCAFNCEKV